MPNATAEPPRRAAQPPRLTVIKPPADPAARAAAKVAEIEALLPGKPVTVSAGSSSWRCLSLAAARRHRVEHHLVGVYFDAETGCRALSCSCAARGACWHQEAVWARHREEIMAADPDSFDPFADPDPEPAAPAARPAPSPAREEQVAMLASTFSWRQLARFAVLCVSAGDDDRADLLAEATDRAIEARYPQDVLRRLAVQVAYAPLRRERLRAA